MLRPMFVTIVLAVIALVGADSASAQFAPSRPQGPRGPGGPPQYRFGQRSHVDRLASKLYREANDICWEMHRHYRDNRNFTAVYRDMYQLKETAKRIDFLVRGHRGQHPRLDDRIARELHEMDRQWHEFKADVRRWRPDSNFTPRAALHIEIAECQETLHHLMDDYGVKTHYDDDHHHDRDRDWDRDRDDRDRNPPIGNRPGFPRR